MMPAAASQAAGPEPAVVVELFTSQGCESCPPADALLGELAGRADLVALAFHVDYWDYIGWKDPYGSKEATARQRGYAAALGSRTIYTPQLVIQGAQHEIGSDRRAVQRAIGDALKPTVAVRLRRSAAGVSVSVEKGRGPAELWLVGYDPRHETKVARGENAGRTLTEYNIVRGFQRVGDWTGEPLELAIPSGELPPGAALAVLLQHPGLGPILGVARFAGPGE
jgi:hypothetical protein